MAQCVVTIRMIAAQVLEADDLLEVEWDLPLQVQLRPPVLASVLLFYCNMRRALLLLLESWAVTLCLCIRVCWGALMGVPVPQFSTVATSLARLQPQFKHALAIVGL
jgi:hypothetical protein